MIWVLHYCTLLFFNKEDIDGNCVYWMTLISGNNRFKIIGIFSSLLKDGIISVSDSQIRNKISFYVYMFNTFQFSVHDI